MSRAPARPPPLSPALRTMIAGLVVQVFGLAIDGLLHHHDPSLAGREQLFTLTNPGHLLTSIGLALSLLGAAFGLGLTARATVATSLAMVSVAATVTLWGGGAAAVPASGHTHVAAADAGAALSATRLEQISATLATTRAATERFRDVDTARANGYHQEGPSLAGSGAHFVNSALVAAGEFDPARPPILLYERQADRRFELVGVAWLQPKLDGDERPPSILAPLATWHYHTYAPPGVCIDGDGFTNLPGPLCLAKGGRHWAHSPWMLHAWLYRDSPDGLFSAVNSNVAGTQLGRFDL